MLQRPGDARFVSSPNQLMLIRPKYFLVVTGRPSLHVVVFWMSLFAECRCLLDVGVCWRKFAREKTGTISA
jgi:hypothetical protein